MFTIENYLLVGLFISSINTSIVMPMLWGILYQPSTAGFISNGVLWPVTLWRWINYLLPSNKGKNNG